MDFGGVLEAETMDSVWERELKSHFCSHSIFTLSHPFGNPFALQNAPKIPFWLTLGALGSEFSTSVASTFQQCFLKACLDSILAKRIQKGRGPVSEGMTP